MFRKNLTDLVKGIRAHSKDESRYIAAALQARRLTVSSLAP